jgi:hypothetical protein
MVMTDTGCPSWCVNGDEGVAHAHVSADVIGGAADQPLMARLIRMEHSDDVHVLVNDRVATLDEVSSFLGGLRTLLDQARLAKPGLGFVGVLVDQAGLTLEELGEHVGVEPARVRKQAEGGQVLSRHELDELALGAASIASGRLSA